MQALSTSGSLSIAQTLSRVAESWTSPLIVIAIGAHSVAVRPAGTMPELQPVMPAPDQVGVNSGGHPVIANIQVVSRCQGLLDRLLSRTMTMGSHCQVPLVIGARRLRGKTFARIAGRRSWWVLGGFWGLFGVGGALADR